MAAVIEFLFIIGIIISIAAGLLQIYDRFANTKKKPDK